ncbi:MAG: HAMP domain-containing protein, partial [Nitrospira sp.]|nr:HAMP domain-containing protein [Nitrospira sp.]
PDLASVKACVGCHEGKQVGDMLGAVSVQIPMDVPTAQLQRNLTNVYLGILAVGVLMMGLLYVLIAKLVVQPMKGLELMAAQAREGDLTVRTQVLSHDEIGRTSESFNAMFDKVSEVIQSVKNAVSGITTGTSEINAGTSDLAERTSAQAGALEETSASMEEMTSTIKQNADNAKQANQLAVAAREVAEKGGTVTDKAVEAMSEINKSSKKIADIINVIDEIAFQTNLLALNAAVEAARAGEQGRGFAVVASEVRNLAQRSATAAKEIKALINESVQKVGDGSELVNRSGQTLEEIVNSVKRVTDIISEISAASQEQAAGIDQVNKAVMQMDQGTQQNAALVEEATSASQSMAHQAQDLLHQVEFFKVKVSSEITDFGKDESAGLAELMAKKSTG